MVDQAKAIRIAKKKIRDGTIQKIVEYKNWFLLIIFTPDPYEGQMDAIYSVDKGTGQFRGFPYLKDEYFEDVMTLFEEAPPYEEEQSASFSDRAKQVWELVKIARKTNIRFRGNNF